MHPTRRALLLAPAMATLLARHPARAQAISELRRNGQIRIGVLKDFPPFGGIGPDGDPYGFEVDVARLIGHHLSVRVRLVPLSAGDRIDALVNNQVDVIAAQFGITSGRAVSVAFATPHLLTDGGLFAARSLHIAGPDDLAGLRIGVVWGSPADIFNTTQMGQKAEILRFDTDSATFGALTAKTVDVISEATNGADAYATAHPDIDMELKLVQFSAPNALAVRQDAVALHQWLNTFVFFTRQTGELDAIWQKWLKRKLPELPAL